MTALRPSTAGAPEPFADARHALERDGACVLRALIAPQKIERLVTEFRAHVVPSLRRFLRQSSYPAWQSHTWTSHGHMAHSLLDVHDDRTCEPWTTLPTVCGAVRDILCGVELRRALDALQPSPNGLIFERHRLVQSMLFEANTETAPHQDGYYLDSDPHGRLLGVWVALEPIHADAGRFFTMRGSHRHDFALSVEERASHPRYLEAQRRYFDAHRDQVVAPALEVGDVLCWWSSTVHGSLPTIDASRSRASLTGHFLPHGVRYGAIREASIDPESLPWAEQNGVQYLLRRHRAPQRHASDLIRAARSLAARLRYRGV